MKWYSKYHGSIIKEAVAVKRNGLLGLGNAGWLDKPKESDIRDAIEYVKESYDIDIDEYALSDMGYVNIEELPGDLSGWLETERGSVELPFHGDYQQTANEISSQVSSRDFGMVINQLMQGQLSPVIAFEDYDIVDGRGRINVANALDIPVRLFILSRRGR